MPIAKTILRRLLDAIDLLRSDGHAGMAQLSDADVDRIARRVVELQREEIAR